MYSNIMMKKISILASSLLLSATASFAQYPQYTDEAQQLIKSLEAQWKAHSDSAWQVAFPIVIQEAKEGRPYVPWAARPYDLRQARYPPSPVPREVACTPSVAGGEKCSP